MGFLVFLIFSVCILILISMLSGLLRRISSWNRVYDRLSARYGGKGHDRTGKITYAMMFSNPSLSFDYGRSFCVLRNGKSNLFSTGKKTELIMSWPNRRQKFDISTEPNFARRWGSGSMNSVILKDLNPEFANQFYVQSNSPAQVLPLLTSSVQWQLEQLRRHTGNEQLYVSVNVGKMIVSKPGFIKKYQALEDFTRFSLELFDQLMLVDAEGLEFVADDQAAIVSDVKCPICSEEITYNMVVCCRCKTPHCQDCWLYNGQCATFGCGETRHLNAGTIEPIDHSTENAPTQS